MGDHVVEEAHIDCTKISLTMIPPVRRRRREEHARNQQSNECRHGWTSAPDIGRRTSWSASITAIAQSTRRWLRLDHAAAATSTAASATRPIAASTRFRMTSAQVPPWPLYRMKLPQALIRAVIRPIEGQVCGYAETANRADQEPDSEHHPIRHVERLCLPQLAQPCDETADASRH